MNVAPGQDHREDDHRLGVVADHDPRFAEVRRQGIQQAGDGLSRLRIEVAGGFFGQQQGGRPRQVPSLPSGPLSVLTSFLFFSAIRWMRASSPIRFTRELYSPRKVMIRLVESTTTSTTFH